MEFTGLLTTIVFLPLAGSIVIMLFLRRDRDVRYFAATISIATFVTMYRKYYFDEMYERYIVTKGFYNGIARSLDWTDKSVVDRTMAAVGWLGANTGSALRQVQTGQLQSYGAMVSVGILVIFGIFLITR